MPTDQNKQVNEPLRIDYRKKIAPCSFCKCPTSKVEGAYFHPLALYVICKRCSDAEIQKLKDAFARFYRIPERSDIL